MRRLALWVIDREENDRWVPRRLLGWAFGNMFKHGTPVTFGVRSARPLVVVNPEPQTWGTPMRLTNVTTTWPLASLAGQSVRPMRRAFRSAVVFSLGFWAAEALRYAEHRAGYQPGAPTGRFHR